jgi:ABC-type antimicrobial peptide transport system permease subunit
MEYRFAPIYKYLVLVVIFFLFMSYYKTITNEKYLPIVLIFVIVMFIVDHMSMLNHPHLTSDKKEQIYDELMEEGMENIDDDDYNEEEDEEMMDDDEKPNKRYYNNDSHSIKSNKSTNSNMRQQKSVHRGCSTCG